MTDRTQCDGCYWNPGCLFCGTRCDHYTPNDYGATADYREEAKHRALTYSRIINDYSHDESTVSPNSQLLMLAGKLASRYGR